MSKRKQTKYDPVVLALTVERIREGKITYRQAEIETGIPKSTLSDHVNRIHDRIVPGPEPALTPAIEDRIFSWLKKMAEIGYGKTKKDLFEKVAQIVTKLNISTPFNDNRPSESWYRGFMGRYPELKRKQALLLSKQRAGITRENLNEWFTDLRKYLETTGNEDILEEPSRIFNADETGFPLAPRPGRVIASTKQPHVYQFGSSSKQQITVLVAASASAHYISPLVVFPGTNFRQTFMEHFYNELPDAVFGRSGNGWMDQELFLNWLQSGFDPECTKKGIKRPILLMVDGARVHISLDISKFCDQNRIILYVFFPNATHLIQPLDLSFMGIVKVNYKECVREWSRDNPGESYDKVAFLAVFREAWKRSTTVEAAVKGFKQSGLYPWNPKAVDGKKLAPAELYEGPKEADVLPEIDTSVNDGKAEEKKGECVIGDVRYALVPIQNKKVEEKTNNEVLTELLMPPRANSTPKRAKLTGVRAPGLPRCISSNAYRNMAKATDDKKTAELKAKEERKRVREESKRLRMEKEAEAKRKREELKADRLLAQMKRSNIQRNKLKKPPTPVTSTDSSSEESIVYASSSSGAGSESDAWYEGSTSSCARCMVRFTKENRKLAIGCDTEFCRRWFHRECTGLELDGKTEEEIENLPFNCVFCKK